MEPLDFAYRILRTRVSPPLNVVSSVVILPCHRSFCVRTHMFMLSAKPQIHGPLLALFLEVLSWVKTNLTLSAQNGCRLLALNEVNFRMAFRSFRVPCSFARSWPVTDLSGAVLGPI